MAKAKPAPSGTLMKASTQVAAITGGGPTQTILVPGCQGTPVGVRIVVSSGVTNGSRRPNARIGFGYSDFTNSRAFSVQSQDNVATSNCNGRRTNDAVISLCNENAATQDAKATVSATDGGVILNWSDLPAQAVMLDVTVYFGDVQVNLHEITTNATVNLTATKSGLAFRPNALEMMSIATSAWTADTTFANNRGLIGQSVQRADATTILQLSYSAFDTNNATTTSQCAHEMRDDCTINQISVSSGGVLTQGTRADVTSYTSDGYVVTTRNVGGALVLVVFAIRYGHGERWCGVVSTANLDTTTTGAQAQTIPSPSFKPLHLDVIGTDIPTKNSASETNIGMCFGTCSAGLAQDNASWSTKDAANPTSCDSGANNIAVEVVSQGSNLGWTAQVDSMNADGWTPHVLTASTTTKVLSGWVAIGFGQDPMPPVWHPWRKWRRQLARM